MKRNKYASTSLNEYLNESRAFMLKRGYGDKKPVIVGAKANVRDQVLPFVAESKRVSKKDLVSFITGLNEGTKRSAVNMWIKRNAQFFIAESKGGKTFFKLSKLGERLMQRVAPIMEAKKKAEGEHDFVDKKKGYDRPGIYDKCDEGDDGDEAEEEKVDEAEKTSGAAQAVEDSYLKGKKKKMHKGSWANLLEKTKKEEDEEEKLEETGEEKPKTVKSIIEQIKAKREALQLNEKQKAKPINEEDDIDLGDDEDESDEDELTFDDIDLGDDEAGEDVEGDDAEDAGEGEVEDVEIAEFILTVDDAAAAIAELEERGISAELIDDVEDDDIEGDEDLVDDEVEGDEDAELDLEEPAGDELDLDSDVEDAGEGDDLDFDLEEADEKDEVVDDEIDLGLGDDEADDGLDLGDDEADDELDLGDDDVEDIDMGDDEEIEKGEADDQKIRVNADQAEELIKWLEEKGVDIEDMFGGELAIEGDDDDEDIESAEDVDDEDDSENAEEVEADDEDAEDAEDAEEEVEESVTGMEKEEKAMTPNLTK